MTMAPIRKDPPRGKTRKELGDNICRGDFRLYVAERKIAEVFDNKLDTEGSVTWETQCIQTLELTVPARE